MRHVAMIAVAMLMAGSASADEVKSTKIVGTAQMAADGTITLRVNTDDGGANLTRLPFDAAPYITVRGDLPDLKPGGTVDLPEWVVRDEVAEEAQNTVALPPVYANSAAVAADGTITLHAQVGHGYGEPVHADKAYPKADPAYADVLGLSGGVAPGETKSLPGESADPALVQARFLTVADGFGLKTGIDDVLAPMGTPEWAIDQPCSGSCFRQYEMGEGDGASKGARLTLWQMSNRLNGENYHYDRPFVAEAVEFTAVLPAGTCFDAASWSRAVTARGWSAPRAFAFTHQVWAPEPELIDGKMRQIDVEVRGFVTRRGKVDMVLMTDPDGAAKDACPGTMMVAANDGKVGKGIAGKAYDAGFGAGK